MNKMDPTEVLNDNMEFLIDYLMRELRCLGKMNGLSNSQLIYMEREFIARLAFAAIIGDEKEDCESCPAKDHCSFKEPEEPEEPDKKTVPNEVWKALRFVKNHCDLDCDDCPFGSLAGISCHLESVPSDWEV